MRIQYNIRLILCHYRCYCSAVCYYNEFYVVLLQPSSALSLLFKSVFVRSSCCIYLLILYVTYMCRIRVDAASASLYLMCVDINNNGNGFSYMNDNVFCMWVKKQQLCTILSTIIKNVCLNFRLLLLRLNFFNRMYRHLRFENHIKPYFSIDNVGQWHFSITPIF